MLIRALLVGVLLTCDGLVWHVPAALAGCLSGHQAITVSPGAVRPGQSVHVVGDGFAPCNDVPGAGGPYATRVRLTFVQGTQTVDLGWIDTLKSRFSTSVCLPLSAQPGKALVKADEVSTGVKIDSPAGFAGPPSCTLRLISPHTAGVPAGVLLGVALTLVLGLLVRLLGLARRRRLGPRT